MSARRAIGYLRVSTARQGQSGLGLDAQRTAVQAWAVNANYDLVGEFVEVESGKRNDRPELARALTSCRLHRATLVIAKLDRLARNVAFIANLMDSGSEFIAVDHPHANRLTLHVMAAMAEYEREQISQRTKAALAAAKARGVRLGNPKGAAHLRPGARAAAAISVQVRREMAIERAHALIPTFERLAHAGIKSLRSYATALNELGVPTVRGSVWKSEQVRRLLRLLEGDAPPTPVALCEAPHEATRQPLPENPPRYR